jgi:hypothetical protein
VPDTRLDTFSPDCIQRPIEYLDLPGRKIRFGIIRFGKMGIAAFDCYSIQPGHKTGEGARLPRVYTLTMHAGVYLYMNEGSFAQAERRFG